MGAETCPDEASLRREVAKRVGYDPFFPHAARSVVLTMFGRSDRLTARIDLVEDERAAASRELVTAQKDCEELFQSAALAIAIAIDPRALVRPSPSQEPVQPKETSTVQAGSVERESPPIVTASAVEPTPKDELPRPRSSPGTVVEIDVGPRASTGFQPGVAAGAFAGASVAWRHWSLGAEAGGYLPTLATSASSPAAASVWTATASVVPCLRFGKAHACGMLAAGRFEASGERVTGGTTRALAFVATGVRFGLDLSVAKRVALRIDGDILGNLARPTVKVGEERVWKASPVAFSLGTALAIEL